MGDVEFLQDNIGWWGSPLDKSTKRGVIVWPKRDLKNPTPEVGAVIVDESDGRYFGFKVLSINNGGGLITDDSYLTVESDGREYFKEQPHD